MIALLPHFRLEVIVLDNIYLGNLIDRLLKKEPFIIQNHKELQNIATSIPNNYTNKK